MLGLGHLFKRAAEPFDRVPAAPTSALEAGRNGRRLRDFTRLPHVNDATGAATTIRERARASVLNNPWLASGVEALVANIVGTGITPRPEHPNAATREELAALWLRWTDDADAEGMTDLYGIQAAVVRALVIDGEAFVRFRPRDPAEGYAAPLQLQIIPAEQVDESLHVDLESGGRVRAGIELDAEGRRVAFHVRRSPPGEVAYDAGVERVPASEMLHVMRPVMPGQVRGVSWLASGLVRAKMLDEYEDAELVRQKIAALFVGFVKKTGDADPFNAQDNGDGEGVAPLEPGAMQYLRDDEDVTFPTTPDPLGGDFAKRHLRAIAAGLGVPYAAMTGDLSDTSYSSARTGLLEFRRRVEQFQHGVLVHQFCRPVWGRFVRLAALAGAIEADDPAALDRVKWLPPHWDWVDPSKDARAELEQINAGLKSRAQAISERGYDVEQVDAEIAADREREQRLGLSFGAAAPTAPAAAPDNKAEAEDE